MNPVTTPGTPVVTTSGTSTRTIVIIVVIFIIIIIIAILIFMFGFRSSVIVNIRPIQSPCTLNEQCAPGLVCSNGICLSPIGGPCTTLSDCANGATSCFQGVCINAPLSGIGGIPPCLAGLVDQNNICVSPELGPCESTDDCLEGFKCRDGECVRRSHGFDKPCSSMEPCDFGFTCDFKDKDDDCDDSNNNKNSRRCKNGRRNGGNVNGQIFMNDTRNGRKGRCKISDNSMIPCLEDDQCMDGSECHKHRCVRRRHDESSNCDSSSRSSSEQTSKSSDCKSSSKDASSTTDCPSHKSKDKSSKDTRSKDTRSKDKSSKDTQSETHDLSSISSSSPSSGSSFTIPEMILKDTMPKDEKSSEYLTIDKHELRANLTSGIKLTRDNNETSSRNIISQKLINRLKTPS